MTPIELQDWLMSRSAADEVLNSLRSVIYAAYYEEGWRMDRRDQVQWILLGIAERARACQYREGFLFLEWLCDLTTLDRFNRKVTTFRVKSFAQRTDFVLGLAAKQFGFFRTGLIQEDVLAFD